MSEIYYICDQKRQCSTSPGCIKNGGECSHTKCISNAVNFEKDTISGSHIEIVRK